jgi:large subunit ribosomal protein L25
MEKHQLQADARSQVGRKVKKLRTAGKIPATVYGKNVPSIAVSVVGDTFVKVYEKAGSSALVELTVDGSVRPVLIHNVQNDVVTGAPLHIEFFQVDLKQKVRTKVPLEFTGEAQAVLQKAGVLLTIIDEVEVEALPTELPEHIGVDVSGLKALDEELKVADIKAPKGVTVLTDTVLTIAKIGPLVTKEAEAEAAAEAAAAAASAAEAAPTAEAGSTEESAAKAPEAAPAKAPEQKKE